jgi:menaquinone-dependent protoporphyrinogen oxidase
VAAVTSVLVAYGSKRGATAEIARWIGDGLRESGLQVDVKAADEVDDVTPYDAVVLGGAVYAARWHKETRRFARRHAGSLADKPVWLFSSGPLDHSADKGDLPPIRHVVKAMAALHARDHRMFGGCLASDAKGFITSSVAERMAGDYRDREQVRAWAADIADDFAAVSI